MPGQVQYRTKLTQSGIFLVWYWTKILDDGMPMPALISLMPMPSYEYSMGQRGVRGARGDWKVRGVHLLQVKGP